MLDLTEYPIYSKLICINMEDLNKYITLYDGTKMPLIGYGTCANELSEEKQLHDLVVYAVTELKQISSFIFLA